jgi:hypothetical protein
MKKRIFSCVAMLGFVTVGFAIAHKRVEGGIPAQELVRMPSAFKTAFEGINIVGINLVYDQFNDQVLDVTIRNNTARNVRGILLESITSNHSSGYGLGSADSSTILPAFGTMTMKFQASSLLENAPLTVAVIFWEDGTTSGDPKVAERLKKSVARAAEQAAIAEKAGHQ